MTSLAIDIRNVAEACARKLELPRALSDDAFKICRGYAGPGYGIATPGMLEAVQLMARLEGILLDPVYTGKAMAGLIDLIRCGHFAADETIVFIHTGGIPAMFAYADHF